VALRKEKLTMVSVKRARIIFVLLCACIFGFSTLIVLLKSSFPERDVSFNMSYWIVFSILSIFGSVAFLVGIFNDSHWQVFGTLTFRYLNSTLELSQFTEQRKVAHFKRVTLMISAGFIVAVVTSVYSLYYAVSDIAYHPNSWLGSVVFTRVVEFVGASIIVVNYAANLWNLRRRSEIPVTLHLSVNTVESVSAF
jgi:hypothetical protein